MTIATGTGRFRYVVAQNDIYAPTMMTSPWAKLSIFAMPYTMVYPSAIIAYTLPRPIPFIRLVNKFIKSPLYYFKRDCRKTAPFQFP